MSTELASVVQIIPWVAREFVSPELTERYVRVILAEIFSQRGTKIDWGAITRNGLAFDLGPYPRQRDPTQNEVEIILRERFINGRR